MCGSLEHMADTTTRALALLNLLQAHRHWPGAELAQRLGVTERTVRRDVERLRELGVIVQTTSERSNVLKIKPPLCLTATSADAVLAALDRVLAEGW